MRSAEGFVLKRFLLIFSDLIFDSKVDPVSRVQQPLLMVQTPVLRFRAVQPQSSLSLAPQAFQVAPVGFSTQLHPDSLTCHL